MTYTGVQLVYITTDDDITMGAPFEPKLCGMVCMDCKPGPGGSLEICDRHIAVAIGIPCWAIVESEKMGGEVEQV